MTIKTLTRRANVLLDQARRLYPEKEQGFTFSREHFTAQEYVRLQALLAEVEPLYQYYSNGWVKYHALSNDQFDQLLLWVCLQHEIVLQHNDHAAIIRLWLNTPWQEDAARLAACDNKDTYLPYTYAFHYEMLQAKAENADQINAVRRLEIRQFLRHREQGIDFEPCINTERPGRL